MFAALKEMLYEKALIWRDMEWACFMQMTILRYAVTHLELEQG